MTLVFKLALIYSRTLKNAFVPLPGGGTAVYDSNAWPTTAIPTGSVARDFASTPDGGVYSETDYD